MIAFGANDANGAKFFAADGGRFSSSLISHQAEQSSIIRVSGGSLFSEDSRCKDAQGMTEFVVVKIVLC